MPRTMTVVTTVTTEHRVTLPDGDLDDDEITELVYEGSGGGRFIAETHALHAYDDATGERLYPID